MSGAGDTADIRGNVEGFDVDRFLNSLEPIGWKLGLERMEMLSEELGRPQDSYATIHVVGTNGKSSVSRMIAAICEAHGHRAGCSVSPHLARWSERVVVSGEELPELFSACVRQAAEAAARVNSRLDGEQVTQFELSAAAAFLTLAEAGVEIAAIEAGLGGRLDATNSIHSMATVLTSIGLDHTEYLGETETGIASEKLAVLRPGTTLVLGPVSAEVRELARKAAADRGCGLVEVDPERPGDPEASAAAGRGPGGFQRVNFSVATAAAACYLGEIVPGRAAEAVAGMVIHGRLEQLDDDPLTLADVAHNPAGAHALASSLPEVTGPGPVIGVIGVLAGKDAPGMISELAGSLDYAVFTGLPPAALAAWGRPGASAWDPEELRRIAGELGLKGETAPTPAAALKRARAFARRRGGAVIITGSHFLLAPGEES
ncbi:MAG: hypothetical protein IT199_05800 [Solirubrobacterales bacterium]|nr:hypothetical protein [Solirubrobacterales bacterium]